MGVFSVKIKVKNIQMTQQLSLEVVVDTGASLSIIPQETLDKIGLKPLWQRQFTLANGEKIERDVGIAIFNWNGHEGASEVIFGKSEDKPLLGALTLESLGLKVNSREQKIEPGEMWLLTQIMREYPNYGYINNFSFGKPVLSEVEGLRTGLYLFKCRGGPQCPPFGGPTQRSAPTFTHYLG